MTREDDYQSTPALPDYQSAPALPDVEGKMLLEELENLYGSITFDEKGKKVRRGSDDERYAIAALRKAMIDAALKFKRHEDFNDWLNRNMCFHLDCWDPTRGHDKQVDAIYDLEWRVQHVEEETKHLNHMLKLLLDERLKAGA